MLLRSIFSSSTGAAIRFAGQRSRRNWKLTIAVALVLGFGIATATALLSLLQAALYSSPWADAASLVAIYEVRTDRRNVPSFKSTWNRQPLSWRAWQEIEKAAAFEAVGTWFTRPQIFGENRTDVVETMYASSGLFDALKVNPSLGRLFTAAEDREESEAALLTEECVQQYLSGDPEVLGKTITIAPSPGSPGIPKTVVGILPVGFRLQGTSPAVVLPMGVMAFNGSFESNKFLFGIARLRDATTRESVQAQITPLVRGSESAEHRTARLVDLRKDEAGAAAYPMWLLFGGSIVLLLVTCANAAGLLLADAKSRTHEFGVRFALGATRTDVLRQLLVEHTVLALIATVCGLLFAIWLTPAITSLAPPQLLARFPRGVDASMFAGTLIACGTVVIFVAVAPMFLASASPTLSDSLRVRSLGTTARVHTLHRSFVSIEIALAVVLLVVASLFSETLLRLSAQRSAVDPALVAVAVVSTNYHPDGALQPVPGAEQAADARDIQMRRRRSGWVHTAGALDRLASLPGVVAVAGAESPPLVGRPRPVSIRPKGHSEKDATFAIRRVVTESYLSTMGLRLVAGREFAATDRRGLPVAIVSAELERRYRGELSIGSILQHGPIAYQIIGVSQDEPQTLRPPEDLPAFYVLNWVVEDVKNLVVRGTVPADTILESIRERIRSYDARMTVTRTATLDVLQSEASADQRFRAILATTYSASTILLAIAGLFSHIALWYRERHREISIRVAVGAGPSHLRWLIVRQFSGTVAIGIVTGLGLAYAVASILSSLLFGVSPFAAHTFLFALTIAVVATMFPMLLIAWRAGRPAAMIGLRD